MARISQPTDLGVPTFILQGVPFEVPVDLPEGGFLQVVVGENPMGQAFPSRQIPKGCMVAIVPAHVAEKIRPFLDKVAQDVNNPGKWLGAMNGGGNRITPP